MLKIMSLYDSDTATDGIIFAGIKNILGGIDENVWSSPIIGTEEFDHQSVDTSDLEVAQFRPDEKFDMVLIPGTPWLWDSFQKSHKYRNLIRMIDAHPEAKKVFFGIGTALNMNVGGDVLSRPDEKGAMVRMAKDALVIVRDGIAKHKLLQAGVNCHHLPCPAYFCYGPEFKEPTSFNDNVLIWYNPLTGISKGYWGRNPELFQNYLKMVKRFVDEYSPKVYTVLNCHTAYAEDQKHLNSIGVTEFDILKTSSDTKSVMENANIVMSGRVHCSVPAYVQGKAVSLLRIDSRANVLTDFGGKENGQFCEVGKKDFSAQYAKYIELLSNHLG